MKTAAIIPALNEYQHLSAVVEQAARYVDNVIVVDDGSRQPLENFLPNHQYLHVLRHRINLGKGAALKTGVQYAAVLGVAIVVFLDADGQHDASEIPKILAPLLEGRSDVVFGVRKFHGTMPLTAKIGNVFLTLSLQVLYGVTVSDTQSGYRAFRMAVYPSLQWESARYSVETEMIVNAGKAHLSFTEVPITTIYLDKYRGTTFIDGIRIFLNMLLWRFL